MNPSSGREGGISDKQAVMSPSSVRWR